MSTTRIGKIGRLPQQVRNELNRRLHDGEPGKGLVDWLNGRPEVKKVLHQWFEGRPVTEQNLSEWKQGGYADWERQEEARAWVRELAEDAGDLGPAGAVCDGFASVLAVELTRLAKELLAAEADPEKRWETLCKVNEELSRLRREEQRSTQTRLREERWELEKTRLEEEETERKETRERDEAIAPMRAVLDFNLKSMLHGGGKLGNHVAIRTLEHEYRLKPGTLEPLVAPLIEGQRKQKANPTQSDRIQPEDGGLKGEGGGERRTNEEGNPTKGAEEAGAGKSPEPGPQSRENARPTDGPTVEEMMEEIQ